MRVAVLSAEAVPYSKTGGLGDVAGALPKALQAGRYRLGSDHSLLPQTKGEYLWHTAIDDLRVDWRGRNYQAKAFYSEANGSPTFLIDAPSYFHRDSIYGYTEDYERFAFFNHAALVLIKRLGPPPDIVHLNDWHCGFAAVELASKAAGTLTGAIRGPSFRFTIWLIKAHSVRTSFGNSALAPSAERNAFAFNGYSSAMKAGLAVSDLLSTVSPTYGYEIQTSQEGYGLDWLLRQRSNRLIGITNGVDYDVWNPETDPELPAHFNIDDRRQTRVQKSICSKLFSARRSRHARSLRMLRG